jgi:hypothetical protein
LGIFEGRIGGLLWLGGLIPRGKLEGDFSQVVHDEISKKRAARLGNKAIQESSPSLREKPLSLRQVERLAEYGFFYFEFAGARRRSRVLANIRLRPF